MYYNKKINIRKELNFVWYINSTYKENQVSCLMLLVSSNILSEMIDFRSRTKGRSMKLMSFISSSLVKRSGLW